jgi:hypothetical protein
MNIRGRLENLRVERQSIVMDDLKSLRSESFDFFGQTRNQAGTMTRGPLDIAQFLQNQMNKRQNKGNKRAESDHYDVDDF